MSGYYWDKDRSAALSQSSMLLTPITSNKS